MPADVDARLAARGGVKRWRSGTLPNGEPVRYAIVRDPGPRGGHVVVVKRGRH